jgi:hypothetical protein
MNDNTTNLKEIRNGTDFTWGEMVKIHELGPYTIGEYHPWETEGCVVRVGVASINRTSYHIWIDGKSMGCSAESLEGAIVLAIALKYDGLNTRAAGYFMKMIGANEA